MRGRVAGVAVALAVVLASCSGNGEGEGEGAQGVSTTTTTAPPPESSASAPTTTTPTTDEVVPGGRCFNPVDRYAVERPPGWRTNEGGVLPRCSLFDPEPIAIPEASEIPFDIGVSVRVDAVPFGAAVDGLVGEVRAQEDREVAGRPALRLESTAIGAGLGPAGTTSLRWLVDLGDRTLVAATYDVGSPAFAEKVTVLDAMVASLQIEVDEVDEGAEEGTIGDAPVAVGPLGTAGLEPVAAGGFPTGGGPTALLTDVRIGRHDGFDRVVLELVGEAPSYRVGYADEPVRADGSGDAVEVAGDAALEVRLAPASGFDMAAGAASYEGPLRIAAPGAGVVQEVVRTGDFEAQLAWVIGVAGQVPFSVTLLEDPTRLVVDLVAPPGT